MPSATILCCFVNVLAGSRWAMVGSVPSFVFFAGICYWHVYLMNLWLSLLGLARHWLPTQHSHRIGPEGGFRGKTNPVSACLCLSTHSPSVGQPSHFCVANSSQLVPLRLLMGNEVRALMFSSIKSPCLTVSLPYFSPIFSFSFTTPKPRWWASYLLCNIDFLCLSSIFLK